MKKNIILSFAVLLGFLLLSCEGPEGPPGPQGPSGNANVWSLSYVIYPDDWIEDGFGFWYDQRSTPVIDQYVVDYGAVLFYLKDINGGNTYTQLPSTEIYRDEAGNVYSLEYAPWHGAGMLELQFYDTHPVNPYPPDWNCVIKVVIVDGNPAAMKKLKEIDTSSYDEVKAAFNLE